MKFDFISSNHARNPAEVFDKLRLDGEVVRVKLPILGKIWMTTSHAATAALLKNDDRFRLRNPKKGGRAVGSQWWMPRSINALANNMLTSDREDHHRLRKLVDQAFQRRAVGQMEPLVEKIAHDLLDAAQLRISKQHEIELVGSYARELPLLVICELLGLDDAHRLAFSREAAKFSDIGGIIGFIRALRPIGRMRRLLMEIIKRERQAQSNGIVGRGLIGGLVQAELDGDRLSEDELVAMIFLLLMAGHETTTHAISTAVLSILETPQAKHWLKEDTARYDLAVEELLRFNSPVQFSKPRYVAEKGAFYGAELQEGDLIMACLGAANRDPTHFDDPEKLNLTRRPNPHLEFGTGIHFCLGFQLARLEIKTALRVLFERHPELKLSQSEPVWKSRLGLRALSELNIVTS